MNSFLIGLMPDVFRALPYDGAWRPRTNWKTRYVNNRKVLTSKKTTDIL
jgi:hypothetical protein